ncbi:MAG TPA: non-homologous end-joining DNA ligase [Streptosporangiaceae bacterium]|nr:non-homologous end-joining DNA ligase [Streptosporangiaceae bacterium]
MSEVAAIDVASGRVTVSGITVTVTNAGKVLFPDDGITKGELIEYYAGAAGRILPYLRGRPLTMERYPDGITGERIVQKNIGSRAPGWVSRIEVKKQGGTVCHAVCDKPATLVYLANLACIEPHVFLSRAGALDRPDQLVVDLDPPGAAHFGDARRCALWLRELLEGELGLTSYVKTTGGNGLHVHVPLNSRDDFEEARGFAHEAAELLAARHPGVITTEQRKNMRGGRVYADVMRNSFAQTAVAPYAVRARPGAPVATPLHWAEAEDPSLAPGRFTIRTIAARLGETEDPWGDMPRRRYGASAARRRLRDLAGAAGKGAAGK